MLLVIHAITYDAFILICQFAYGDPPVTQLLMKKLVTAKDMGVPQTWPLVLFIPLWKLTVRKC